MEKTVGLTRSIQVGMVHTARHILGCFQSCSDFFFFYEAASVLQQYKIASGSKYTLSKYHSFFPKASFQSCSDFTGTNIRTTQH